MRCAFIPLAILTVLLTGCGAEPLPVATLSPQEAMLAPWATPQPRPPTPTHAAVVEVGLGPDSPEARHGGQVWVEHGCNVCHGERAAGRIGPALAHTDLSSEAVKAVIRSGRGSMPAFRANTLADWALDDLYIWLQTLPPGP